LLYSVFRDKHGKDETLAGLISAHFARLLEETDRQPQGLFIPTRFAKSNGRSVTRIMSGGDRSNVPRREGNLTPGLIILETAVVR
jgi:hypothetical protein